MLFNGEIYECKKIETFLKNQIMKNSNYNSNEWNNYLYYGGYPIYFEEENNRVIRNKIVQMIKKVVELDMPQYKEYHTRKSCKYKKIIKLSGIS